MSFRTFMGSIGNAFKTGWNNGNIQKGMAATGMAAFTTGMTASMIHDMKHSGSIFGGGCGCNSFGFGGGMNMFGCNPFMGSMNMGNMYSGMDMFGGMGMLNSMGGNMFGMGNMYGYNNQIGNMMAFQWGQQLVQQAQMGGMYPGMNNFNNFNYQQKELDPLSYGNQDAGEVSADVTTEKGKAFDEGTTALGKESNADDVTIVENVTDGRKGDKAAYKTDLTGLAQSYAKEIGGDDGKIDFDDYYAHEFDGLKEQFPNYSDEQIGAMIKRAFIQMDLNGDGDIDWKEMASSIATYDAGGSGSGKLDGKISKADYSQSQSILVKGTFGEANWKNYKALFGNPEKPE